MPAEETNIKVAVRVRPYNRRELEQNQRTIVKVMDDTTLLFDPDEEDDEFFFQGTKVHYRDITKRVNKKISMEFHRVFDTDVDNVQIFNECTSPLVDSVLNGYNCSVFVYGATGAGKTFTMLGNESSPGLTFLTMRDLFEKIQAQSDTRKFDVGVSYLEVYNEHVMNLLTKTGPLKLREDSNGVVVSGLVLKPIYSAEELLQLLTLGNSNRTQHPTDANAESSRSHAVFQVHIRITDRKTGTKRTVKLSMIDLAGSERAASTKGIGIRFKEGASINKSLLALGNCINKLADGLKHIPYRDSNLTRLLKDSLGGNCQTLMVANVSMSSLTYEDTYNTLKYASRAKKIRTTLRQNVLKSNMPKDFYMRKVNELMAEVDRLKENNKNLSLRSSYDEIELKPWYNRMDAVYAVVIKTQECVIATQSKVNNLNFRTKLKEEMVEHSKILKLDQASVQEDFARFTASISRFSKQIDKQKEELKRWRKKLQDANEELEKLKKEIKESKHVKILQIYQKSKDLEVRNSKQDIYINHISAINSEFVCGYDKQRKALGMACKVLQRSYENLSSTDPKLTLELQNNYEKLLRFIKSNHITFKDDCKRDSGEDTEFTEVNILLNGGKRVHLNNAKDEYDDIDDEVDDNDECASTSNKRQRKCLYVENDFDLGLELLEDTDSDGASASNNDLIKIPGAAAASKIRNLNETHVLSAVTTNDDIGNSSSMSTLSTITSDSKSKVMRKKELVNHILSEKIARVPSNKDNLKSALLKSNNFSHHGLLKTVAAGVLKENKKYSPVRIRKSPRSVMSKAFATTANLVRNQKKSTFSKDAEAPIVRINRAASFRVKK